MKRKKHFMLGVFALLFLIGISNIQAFATTQKNYSTHYYSCASHSNCSYIDFNSSGDVGTGEVYSKAFEGKSTHWPNFFTIDDVWSYKIASTGYAKGTYSVHSSIITQWTSIAFQSFTRTFTHVY